MLLDERAGCCEAFALFTLDEEEEEGCVLSAAADGLGGNEARTGGGEKANGTGEASCLTFGRGGPNGEGSRTTGFLGRDRSRERDFSAGLGCGSSSLRFFELLALRGASRSENSESLPSWGGFFRLNEGSGGGTGDAAAALTARGFSSSRSRSRARSRFSRSLVRSSRLFSRRSSERWLDVDCPSLTFLRIDEDAEAFACDRESWVCGGGIGGCGFPEPEGAGSSRLLSRASTGPDFFGIGGSGELARTSTIGGVAEGFTLYPDPG